MKRTRWIAAAVISLVLLFTANGALPAQPADHGAAQKALSDVVDKLNALTVWFSEAEQQRVRWLKDVQAKDRQINQVSQAVEDASAQLKKTLASLTDLQRNQQALQAKRAEQASKIGEHLAAAYRMSGQDFIKVLLNHESPDTFDRMMRYHSYFSAARAETLRDYQATLTELASTEERLEAQVSEHKTNQQALKREESELIRDREQRKNLIAELDQQVEDRATEQRRLEGDRQRLESLLAELRRRATELDGGQFAARKGSLPWPVKGPLRAGFGQPRADGRLKWHGVVVSASEGTPVTAVFRGRVVFADWLRGFGLLLIIDHGSGYMTLYGQADALLKRSGDWVESGEVIARAGRSGGQTASGLYFEVRQKGAARDPVAWLAKR